MFSEKRYCELISITVFFILLVLDMAMLSINFQLQSLPTLCTAAVLGIGTADFLSGTEQ